MAPRRLVARRSERETRRNAGGEQKHLELDSNLISPIIPRCEKIVKARRDVLTLCI